MLKLDSLAKLETLTFFTKALFPPSNLSAIFLKSQGLRLRNGGMKSEGGPEPLPLKQDVDQREEVASTFERKAELNFEHSELCLRQRVLI